MGTITVVGTGGIIEGNLGASDINVNLDPVLTLDGSADYLTATTADFRGGDSAGAITAWIKTSGDGNYDTIFASADTATDEYFIRLQLVGTYLQVQHKDADTTIYTVRGGTVMNDGSWHHVALVSSGSAISLYVDGVAETLTVIAGSNNGDWFGDMTGSKLDNITIGNLTHNSATDYFDGSIADVRYYNASLTAAQVATLASKINAETSTISNRKHWWKLNDGEITGGTNYEDYGDTSDIDMVATSIVAGNIDYDAFSVNVQDGGVRLAD